MTRVSMRFSADGSRAACLVGDGETWAVELWSFDATADRSRVLPGGETLLTQLLPLVADRALIVRHAPGRHDLVLLDGTEHRLTTVRAPGFRLLAGGPTALAVQTDAATTTVWRIRPDAPRLERLAEVPGRLAGGVVLDLRGRHIGFTRHDTRGPVAVTVDLRTGRWRPLMEPRRAGPTHTLLADPRSGLVMVAAATAGGMGLAYTRRGADWLTFPRALADIEGTVLPLAAAPGGDRVALQVRDGARTRLLVHDVARDTLTEVDLPPGLIGGTAAWSDTGLRFPYRSPSVPSAVATVTDAGVRFAGVDPAARGWPAAGLERFAGVEAVVYGDWRTADQVVVALHGGPDAAWELEHHATLQRLAAAGLAVVAPNQRGSTGYGAEHAAAIHGAWGGPDLDDVAHLGDLLRRERPAGAAAPMLYGESYGAYLALLAAGRGLWSRCAVVAPFLSGARLYAEASAEVQELVDRLGGTAGGGDVLAVADRIRMPLMIVHGDADPTVPVTQSRRLRDHLRRAGHPDLRYREVAGADHDPLGSSPARLTELVEFLTDPRGHRAAA